MNTGTEFILSQSHIHYPAAVNTQWRTKSTSQNSPHHKNSQFPPVYVMFARKECLGGLGNYLAFESETILYIYGSFSDKSSVGTNGPQTAQESKKV